MLPDTPASPDPLPRAQLEVDILASDPAVRASEDRAGIEGPDVRWTVLIVAADPDLRRYLRDCLEERPDLHVAEAASPGAAMDGLSVCLDLLVLDEDSLAVAASLSAVPAIVVAGDYVSGPRGVPRRRTAPQTVIVGPFKPRQLLSRVERLLASRTPCRSSPSNPGAPTRTEDTP